MVTQALHYRDVIQSTYQKRRQVNKKYSMAAFARDLGLAATQLFKVLDGQQDFSLEKARQVAQKLFPKDNRSQEKFLQLYQGAISSEEIDQAAATIAAEWFQGVREIELNSQDIRYVTHWYVVAVFDLLAIKNPAKSEDEIAQKLGIDIFEVRSALRSLEAIGLIKAQGTFYEKTTAQFRTSNNISSREIRNIHREFIGKALQAIEQQSIEQRYLRSRTLLIKEQYLPRLRAAIDRLIHEIDTVEALSLGQADVLYQMNVQLFDLIQNDKKTEDEEIA